jgi:hypothetical protein
VKWAFGFAVLMANLHFFVFAFKSKAEQKQQAYLHKHTHTKECVNGKLLYMGMKINFLN